MNPEQYARDDHRTTVLLKAHLEAGQWKSEAWALADSLSWALHLFARTNFTADSETTDLDMAEYRLAQDRLQRARENIR